MRPHSVLASVLIFGFGCNAVLGNEKGEASNTADKGDDRGNSACAKGFADCNGDVRDGCETRLSDPTHCGECTAQCGAAAPLCVSVEEGHYSCASGCPAEAPALCGYQCIDRRTNASHCGQCDHACPGTEHGEGTCVDSTCQVKCAAGYHACGGKCIAASDPTACGDSCTVCPAGARGTAVCNNGTCGISCSPGYADCDSDARNGCEIALLEDAKSCGACGRVCTNARCVGGFCLALGGATTEE